MISQYFKIFTQRNTVILLLLGFASGLPLALTSGTLQAWMTVENVDLKTIGIFSLVGQAYVFKFLWSPMMDRYTPSFLGRRRGWLILTQLLLVLAIFAMGFMDPSKDLFWLAALAVLIALGRRSKLKAIRSFCVFYVEIVRGVPLITVLFTASFLFPLFLPPGMNIDALLRVQIGIILFTAAYLAETIRGGLQAIPRGQYEAAAAMGLTYWQTVRKISLPQALRIVVAPLVNTFISTFMDTSLVTIVSLYDLTGALRLALGDPNWKAFFVEGYLFIAFVYFVCCYGMSRYSRWVERHLTAGMHR